MSRPFTPNNTSVPSASMLDESLRSIALDDADETTVTSRATKSQSVLPILEFEGEDDEECAESSGSKQSVNTLSPQVNPSLSFKDKVKAKSEKCRVLMHGQVVSFLTATMLGVQISMNSSCETFAPAFTAMFAYLVMSAHLMPLVCQGDAPEMPSKKCYSFMGILSLANPLWLHVLVAFLSVESFYCAMWALQYTTASSVSFLDSIGVPIAMVFSRCIFSRRYQKWHILGVLVCLIGTSFDTMQEYQSEHEQITVRPTFRHIQQMGQQAMVTVQRKAIETESASPMDSNMDLTTKQNKFVGDGFALLAGALGGLLDVASEHMIRTSGNVHEYLGVVGLFGCFLSGIQAIAFEQEAIRNYTSGKVCSMELGVSLLVACSVVYYLKTEASARFLRKSEAALLNISLLTSDVYRTLFIIMAEHVMPMPLFWLGFVMIVTGIVVYELDETPEMAAKKLNDSGEIPKDIQVGSVRQKRLE